MSLLSRREFLGSTGSLALAAASGAPALAAMGPNDKFDLVIKGGDVLDPSQNLRGKRDIGIRYGVIEAVEADIPAARAERVLNVDGKLQQGAGPDTISSDIHVFSGNSPGMPYQFTVRGAVKRHMIPKVGKDGWSHSRNNYREAMPNVPAAIPA